MDLRQRFSIMANSFGDISFFFPWAESFVWRFKILLETKYRKADKYFMKSSFNFFFGFVWREKLNFNPESCGRLKGGWVKFILF